MTHIPPRHSHRAETPTQSDAPTLATVLEHILSHLDVPDRRRREVASSLRKLGRMLDRPLERIPADLVWLRRRVKGLTPAMGGISAARFRNIKSDLVSALGHAGITKPEARVYP